MATLEPQGLAPEDLAGDTMVNKGITYVYEVTINLKEGLDMIPYVALLEKLFYGLVTKYKSKNNAHYIEQCISGSPHLHGFIEVEYPASVLTFTNNLVMLNTFCKDFFLLAPKKYWKQLGKAKIYPHFLKFQTPALCVNMKESFSVGWMDYITKNAPKLSNK